jgi:hypothetical protein
MDKKESKARRRAKAADDSGLSVPSREFLAGLKRRNALGGDAHAEWASGIVAKLGVKATGLWRVAMIDLLRTKRRTGATSIHNGPLYHTHQHSHFNVLHQHKNSFYGASAGFRLNTSLGAMASSGPGDRREFAAGAGNARNSSNLMGAPLAYRKIPCRKEIGIVPEASDVLTSRLMKTNMLRRSGGMALFETVEEHSVTDMVTRLARKHRRNAVKRSEIGAGFGVPATRAVFMRRAGEEKCTTSRERVVKADNSGAIASAASVAAPAAINVTQLTDEVMKQLDRKLVAARERMGRI